VPCHAFGPDVCLLEASDFSDCQRPSESLDDVLCYASRARRPSQEPSSWVAWNHTSDRSSTDSADHAGQGTGQAPTDWRAVLRRARSLAPRLRQPPRPNAGRGHSPVGRHRRPAAGGCRNPQSDQAAHAAPARRSAAGSPPTGEAHRSSLASNGASAPTRSEACRQGARGSREFGDTSQTSLAASATASTGIPAAIATQKGLCGYPPPAAATLRPPLREAARHQRCRKPRRTPSTPRRPPHKAREAPNPN
jgi:hypothetical protein